MTANKQQSDIKASYHAMVEAVEEFMVKEGKTIQQAFHAAEEKLADATDASKDSIKQASQELQYNLHLFNDALDGVTQAYKEHILFEWDFINSALWEKFQSIANSNTAELIAFTKNLREQAETATTESHLSAHKQHSQWDSEHAFWLDEIKLWKKNHQQALSKLHDIEKAIKQHATILDQHTNAIKKHLKLEHKHEERMKNAEQDRTSENFKTEDEHKMPQHQHEQQIHAQQAKLHNDIKAKHLQTMAMINMLYTETHKTT